MTIGVLTGTVRVVPNATVNGAVGHRVQPGAFLGQHLDRAAVG